MKPNITTIPAIRAVYYATYANFPPTGLKVGDLAYATDRLVFYRWSGAAWEAVTIHSSSGAAGSIPTAANLPNGSLYYETDTKILKQVQAGAWVSLASPTLTKVLSATIHEDDSSPVAMGTIPAGSVILFALANVTVVKNGTPDIDIGDVTDPDGIMSFNSMGNLNGLGWYPTTFGTLGDYLQGTDSRLKSVQTAMDVIATIAGSPSTDGEVTIYIFYLEA